MEDWDKMIEARNSRNATRRRSVEIETALDDSDYDSEEEDLDETPIASNNFNLSGW